MTPEAAPCLVPTGLETILPGYRFADSFAIPTLAPVEDVPDATRQIFSRQPRWIRALIGLRDRLVAPFGLKSTDHAGDRPSIGGFPVVSAAPGRVVLGFNDRHLDFRIVIEACTLAAGDSGLRATTLVLPHNFAGRSYLALVLPFHRRIVPGMLNRLRSGGEAGSGR